MAKEGGSATTIVVVLLVVGLLVVGLLVFMPKKARAAGADEERGEPPAPPPVPPEKTPSFGTYQAPTKLDAPVFMPPAEPLPAPLTIDEVQAAAQNVKIPEGKALQTDVNTGVQTLIDVAAGGWRNPANWGRIFGTN